MLRKSLSLVATLSVAAAVAVPALAAVTSTFNAQIWALAPSGETLLSTSNASMSTFACPHGRFYGPTTDISASDANTTVVSAQGLYWPTTPSVGPGTPAFAKTIYSNLGKGSFQVKITDAAGNVLCNTPTLNMVSGFISAGRVATPVAQTKSK